jgi:hypothetical protein
MGGPETYGRVDICIIGPGAGWHPKSPPELEPEIALKDMEQEIAPIFYLKPLVLPYMFEREWGRIIGISLHPTNMPPAYSYNAGKMARTQALLLSAQQTWKKGGTVNIMALGPVPEIADFEKALDLCNLGTCW